MLTSVDKPAERVAQPFAWDAFARLSDRLTSVAGGSGEAWLVTGLEGAGKTTLLDESLPRLTHESRRIIRVAVRQTDQLDLSGFAARVFGNTLVRDPPNGDDLDRLTEYLAGPSHGATLLVVDGAHAMRAEVARYIQFAWASAPHLQIVFAARNGFRDLIDRTEFAYLRSRLGPELALPRLSDSEAEQYVEHRLKLVGASAGRLFAEGAMEALVREGQGLPGRINKLEEVGIEIGVMRADRRLTPVSVLQASSQISRTQRDMTQASPDRVAFGRAPPSGNALMVIPQPSPAPRPRPAPAKPPIAGPLPRQRSRAAVLVPLALVVVALIGLGYGVSVWTHPADVADARQPATDQTGPAISIGVPEPDLRREAASPVLPPPAEPVPVALSAPPAPTESSPDVAKQPEPPQADAAETAADEAVLAQAREDYFKRAAALGDVTAKEHLASPTAPAVVTP